MAKSLKKYRNSGKKILKSSSARSKAIFLSVKAYLAANVFTRQNGQNIKQFFIDVKDCLIKVIFGTTLPQKKDLFNFLLTQVIVNACGWTAGMLAGDMVNAYFKTPSAKNLWGIAGKRDGKTMVTKEEFQQYNWWARYLVGLVILLVVRYLVFSTIEEYKKLKEERAKQAAA